MVNITNLDLYNQKKSVETSWYKISDYSKNLVSSTLMQDTSKYNYNSYNPSPIGEFHIENIPNNLIKIEDLDIFQKLLDVFIKEKQEINNIYLLERNDITSNTEMFREFEEFCFILASSGKLSISNNDSIKYKILLYNFRERFGYNTKSVTKYYDEIIKTIYLSEGLKKQDKEIKDDMLKFNTAYHMIKQVFSGLERTEKDGNGDNIRYFEHLKETMEIILRELPFPNIDKLIIALLHDVMEDIPGITYEFLKNLFGKHIADGVRELSKIDWRQFLTRSEKSIIKVFEREKNEKELKENHFYNKIKYKAKEKRNDKYFGHLNILGECYLDVKCADRIHNLRTMKGIIEPKKIAIKILETEKFFLKPALDRKLKTEHIMKLNNLNIGEGRNYAYDLLKKEIIKLKKDPKVLEEYKLQKAA